MQIMSLTHENETKGKELFSNRPHGSRKGEKKIRRQQELCKLTLRDPEVDF